MSTTFLQKPFSDLTSCIEDAQQFKCIYPAFPVVCSAFDSGNIDLRITEERLVAGGFYGAVDGCDRRPFYVLDLNQDNYGCDIQVVYIDQSTPVYLPIMACYNKFYNYSSCFKNVNGTFIFIKPNGSCISWRNAWQNA